MRTGRRAGGRRTYSTRNERDAKLARAIVRKAKRRGKLAALDPRKARRRAWLAKQGRRVRDVAATSLAIKYSMDQLAARMTKADYEAAKQFIKYFNKTTKLVGRRAGKLISGGTSTDMNGPGKPDNRKVPNVSETTYTMRSQSGLGKDMRRIIKTKYMSGEPTSKAILREKSQSGSTVVFGADTKIAFDSDQNLTPDRAQLEQSHGWNERTFVGLPLTTTFTTRQLLNRTLDTFSYTNDSNINAANVSDRQKELVLLSWLNMRTQLKFMNLNSYLPMNIRIHCIAMKERIKYTASLESNISAFFGQVFNATGTQAFGTIPVFYQKQGYVRASKPGAPTNLTQNATDTFSVRVSNKTNLFNSPNFRKKYEIVKSWTERLEPNDIWMFDHTHTFGSGVDFHAARQDIGRSDIATGPEKWRDRSYSHFYLIESWGTPVQAEIDTGDGVPVTTEPYIGTGHGSYLYEYKTSAEFVNTTNNFFRINNRNVDSLCHLRIYKKRDTWGANKEKSVPFNLMTTDRTNVPVGGGFVPVITDLEPATAGPKES